MERFVAFLKGLRQRFWKVIAITLGLITIGDLLKEHWRSVLMEWAVPKLGQAGRWLIANPSALVVLASLFLLLLILSSALTEVIGRSSALVDVNGKPIKIRTFNSKQMTLLTSSVVIAIAFIVYGHHRYENLSRADLYSPEVKLRADSKQTSVEISFANIGDGVVFEDSNFQTSIFVADSHYSREAGDHDLFSGGPEWRHLTLDKPLGPH
jgi:hypothetical protein